MPLSGLSLNNAPAILSPAPFDFSLQNLQDQDEKLYTPEQQKFFEEKGMPARTQSVMAEAEKLQGEIEAYLKSVDVDALYARRYDSATKKILKRFYDALEILQKKCHSVNLAWLHFQNEGGYAQASKSIVDNHIPKFSPADNGLFIRQNQIARMLGLKNYPDVCAH